MSVERDLKAENMKLHRTAVAAHAAVLLSLLGVSASPLAASSWTWPAFVVKVVGATLLTLMTSTLRDLAPSDVKHVLVFRRLRHALPGHRVFTELVPRDSRIDAAAVRKLFGGSLPTAPTEQNAAWYQLYKAHQADPSVAGNHREFLLYRDLFWLTLLVGACGTGVLTLSVHPEKAVTLFALVSGALAGLFNVIAHERGERFATTVIAVAISSRGTGRSP